MDLEAPDNVISLGAFREKRNRGVYQCHCGGDQNQKFFLCEGGRVQCAACDMIHESLCWGQRNGG